MDRGRCFGSVYTNGLVDGHSPALRQLLSSYFESTPAAVLACRPENIPVDLPRDWLSVTTYSRFVGQGLIGAIEAWLELPAPRDPQLYVRAVFGVLPQWLINAPGVKETKETKERSE